MHRLINKSAVIAKEKLAFVLTTLNILIRGFAVDHWSKTISFATSDQVFILNLQCNIKHYFEGGVIKSCKNI